MPSKNLTTLEKIEKNLFRSQDDQQIILSESEDKIRIRYQDCYTYWHDHPDLTESQIIEYLISQYDISKSQAYRDLYNIKYLLGNVRGAGKEWLRYTVIAMCKEAYQKARVKNDFVAMVLAADKIGKYGQLDQQDADGIDWDKLPSPDFEPSGDIMVLDSKLFDPKIEEKRRTLRAKFSGESIDAEFEDVKE